MRALSIGSDQTLLHSTGRLLERLLPLAESAGELAVIVRGSKDETKVLSPHLRVYSVCGSKPVVFFKILRIGKTLLLRTPFDLITVQDVYFLALIGYLLSRRFKIPLEIQVHGLEKFTGLRKLLAPVLLRRADQIRVVSERLRKLLTTNYSLLTTKIYTLPIYSQTEVPMQTIERKAVPHPFTFLTVGRLVPVKDIGMQIEALAELAREFPDVRLLIVGEGKEGGKLKLQARSSKLEAKIRFEGRQENPGQYYKDADAFLLTSISEGWGLVVTEAAAYGLPIVMTDVGLAGEFIKDGENGIVIPVGDKRALVMAMKEMITNSAKRTRLGENARTSFLALPKKEEQIQKQIIQWHSLK